MPLVLCAGSAAPRRIAGDNDCEAGEAAVCVVFAGGALAFVMWGPWSPFVPGQPGFLGEFELLLAAVGLLFLLVGAGGWSVDRSFRSARQRDKAERQLA